MGETLKVPNEELMDLLDDLDPVEKQNWRHGHKDVYVFEKDAKHWRVTIDVHTSEGWDLVGDEQTCERVYPHPVTTIAWKTTPPKVTADCVQHGRCEVSWIVRCDVGEKYLARFNDPRATMWWESEQRFAKRFTTLAGARAAARKVRRECDEGMIKGLRVCRLVVPAGRREMTALRRENHALREIADTLREAIAVTSKTLVAMGDQLRRLSPLASGGTDG